MGRRYAGPVGVWLVLVLMAFTASTAAASTRHRAHRTRLARRSAGLRPRIIGGVPASNGTWRELGLGLCGSLIEQAGSLRSGGSIARLIASPGGRYLASPAAAFGARARTMSKSCLASGVRQLLSRSPGRVMGSPGSAPGFSSGPASDQSGTRAFVAAWATTQQPRGWCVKPTLTLGSGPLQSPSVRQAGALCGALLVVANATTRTAASRVLAIRGSEEQLGRRSDGAALACRYSCAIGRMAPGRSRQRLCDWVVSRSCAPGTRLRWRWCRLSGSAGPDGVRADGG
jgi:hypothetical protein